MKGRHKPSSRHYNAAHLKPNHYTVADCNHPDINIHNLSPISTKHYQAKLAKLIASTDQSDYKKNQKETGISKPSIFSALVERFTFPVPWCFSLNLMHLLFIDLGELLIPLWQGTIKCDPSDDKSTWDWVKLVGDVWVGHSKLIADATPYFPSSFHRPPCNPAEKKYLVVIKLLNIFSICSALVQPSFTQSSHKNTGEISASLCMGFAS